MIFSNSIFDQFGAWLVIFGHPSCCKDFNLEMIKMVGSCLGGEIWILRICQKWFALKLKNSTEMMRRRMFCEEILDLVGQAPLSASRQYCEEP